jgi:hypothetical protein
MGAIADGIVAYTQPLIDQTDGSYEEMSKALAMGQLCFNLAISPQDIREKTMREMQASFAIADEAFADFRRSILDPMIQRHKEMFPRMHRKIGMGPLQSVPSRRAEPRTPDPAERQPLIDRYAPCPCNSGEKYKFCCGKKGR